MKSRYGTDNDLLLEEYNEYETSKDKEEEISEDGKEKGEKVTIKPDNSNSFSKYLNNIKNMSTETNSLAIWGRPEIEGRMICEKYKVKIEVIALEEEPIGGRYITTGEEGEGDKVVRIVNYMRHFVPLLSKIPSDITENQSVSNEEIFGEVTEVPASDQSEQEEQYNIMHPIN